jgi:hypothetical protein
VLHHRGSQQGVQTDSWEICAGVQLDHDERKNSHYSEKQSGIEKEMTELGNYINRYSLCHAEYSAPDFPLRNRVEAHSYVGFKINFRM